MEALVRSAVCYSPPAYNTQVACWFAAQLCSLVLSLNVTVPASAPCASASVSDKFSFHRFANRPRWLQRCPEIIVTSLSTSRVGHTNAQDRPTREPGTWPVADAWHSHSSLCHLTKHTMRHNANTNNPPISFPQNAEQ